MPEYAMIQADSEPFRNTIDGSIGSLEVDGPLVFGAYSGSPESKQAYFAFDTRNGVVLDFSELAELNQHAVEFFPHGGWKDDPLKKTRKQFDVADQD